MAKIAVIDTETTWWDELMSIGVVIADPSDYSHIESRYYIIDPEYKRGGMFSHVIMLKSDKDNRIASREKALKEIDKWLKAAGVSKLFAYNAKFDKRLLTEFVRYEWHDIMRLAAYKQYNKSIPDNADCCGTGRLKKNYGVEPIIRMLFGNTRYCETHNALQDAKDELDIMRMLCLPIEEYEVGRL